MKVDLIEVKGETETKTSSQRLRGVRTSGMNIGKQGEFEDFYKSKMNNIIEQIKKIRLNMKNLFKKHIDWLNTNTLTQEN